MADRDNVRVGVNILFEELGVATVRAETSCAVIKVDLRHTRDARINQGRVLSVTGANFVQNRRRKRMHVAQHSSRESACRRIGKASRTSSIAWPECISCFEPIELQVHTVICVPIVIDLQRRFIAIE